MAEKELEPSPLAIARVSVSLLTTTTDYSHSIVAGGLPEMS
jgi:hypothetical protein